MSRTATVKVTAEDSCSPELTVHRPRTAPSEEQYQSLYTTGWEERTGFTKLTQSLNKRANDDNQPLGKGEAINQLPELMEWSEVAQSCPTLCHPMDGSPPGYSINGIFPGKNTGVGCHFLLSKIASFQQQQENLRHTKKLQSLGEKSRQKKLPCENRLKTSAFH